jgi:hypothetical protein
MPLGRRRLGAARENREWKVESRQRPEGDRCRFDFRLLDSRISAVPNAARALKRGGASDDETSPFPVRRGVNAARALKRWCDSSPPRLEGVRRGVNAARAQAADAA